MASAGKDEDAGLSAVDEDSWFERWVTEQVCGPVARRLPRWVKPNTVSLVNVACNWLALLLAFCSMWLDESQEEYQSGQMRPGRDLWTARFSGLACRLAMAALTFASLVLDCVDGMHARATGQCSHLGEVVDHALDAANIPLIGSAFCIAMGVDKYTVAISMVACGYVFNSQLSDYRVRGRMIKPPTNGPESQMLVVAAEATVAFLFCAVGRFHPRVDQIMVGVLFVANAIQFNNFFYFWRKMDRKAAGDHARFCLTTLAFAVLYLAGAVAQFTYLIIATMIAFRLSGAYVLYVVTNNYKRQLESERGLPPSPDLESPLTSLHGGWDVSTLACIALFALAPHIEGASDPESVLTVVAFVFFHVAMMVDLRHCLPFIAPRTSSNKSMLSLFF